MELRYSLPHEMETDHARIEDRLQSLSSSIAMAMNEPDAPDAWSRLHRLLSQFTRELAAHARFESEWLFSRALEIEHALSFPRRPLRWSPRSV
jgi:iron-sulfur cluster repair protein YtfE (RIC family)